MERGFPQDPGWNNGQNQQQGCLSLVRQPATTQRAGAGRYGHRHGQRSADYTERKYNRVGGSGIVQSVLQSSRLTARGGHYLQEGWFGRVRFGSEFVRHYRADGNESW